MLRSLLISIGAALILVAILSWQNIMSAGVGQMTDGWDRLLAYYNQEPISLPGIVTDESQLKSLVPKMVEADVGLINSPYKETQTERTQLTRRDGECESPRANLDEVAFFLRSNLFEPLAPIAVHHAREAKLPLELVRFFQDYGRGAHKLSTNAAGERVTVPFLEGPRKVLVAGDSAAFGPMLDDSATLASRLQAKDSTRQYVNVGVPGASSELVLCNLTKAASRYQGQVEEVVYLYSEDDFASDQRFGTPEAVIAAIKSLVQSGAPTKVTVVYVPSLYNIVPELTRYRGYAGERIPNPQKQREQLKKSVADAGFVWHDMGDIALERSRSQGNAFSVFDSFTDPRSLSTQGINNLVGKFTLPASSETLALATAPNPEDQAVAATGLENQLRKQSAALDDIRAAAARAAKNNRLKREVGDILKKLKNELAEGQ
jgi:hypothetical protein